VLRIRWDGFGKPDFSAKWVKGQTGSGTQTLAAGKHFSNPKGGRFAPA